MTHTFIEPQVNRKRYYYEDEEVTIAAKIIGKTSEGLVIKGARLLATQGGITDELLVLSTNGYQLRNMNPIIHDKCLFIESIHK